MKLSSAATKVYDALVKEVRATGTPPTIRDLRKLSGFSSISTVHDALTELAEAGKIVRGDTGKARNIIVVEFEEDRDWLEAFSAQWLAEAQNTRTMALPSEVVVRLARFLGVD